MDIFILALSHFSNRYRMNAIGQIDYDPSGEFIAGMEMNPPHDPTRYETTDGFENPNCNNGDCNEIAAKSLAVFQKECGMVDEMKTTPSDLICDFPHLAHASDRDPRDIYLAGIRHFPFEVGEVKVLHS